MKNNGGGEMMRFCIKGNHAGTSCNMHCITVHSDIHNDSEYFFFVLYHPYVKQIIQIYRLSKIYCSHDKSPLSKFRPENPFLSTQSNVAGPCSSATVSNLEHFPITRIPSLIPVIEPSIPAATYVQ